LKRKWLFDVEPEKIEVVIQKESIIHSMVRICRWRDYGSNGQPGYETAYSICAYYPERRFLPGKRVDFFALKELHFEKTGH
jgi:1-deoxy-D-xylulose-5-phosphate reductoisomerase